MSSRGGKKKTTKTSRSTKAGVIFPVGRMLRYIKRGLPKYRIGVGAPVYLAAVLEYLTGEFHLRLIISSVFGDGKLSTTTNFVMVYYGIMCRSISYGFFF